MTLRELLEQRQITIGQAATLCHVDSAQMERWLVGDEKEILAYVVRRGLWDIFYPGCWNGNKPLEWVDPDDANREKAKCVDCGATIERWYRIFSDGERRLQYSENAGCMSWMELSEGETVTICSPCWIKMMRRYKESGASGLA